MLNRREFMAAGALAGAVLAGGCKKTSFAFFSDKDAGTLAAICDQIIPQDDFPSASQAGVLNYIDIQLSRQYKRHRDTYRRGLRQANEICRSRLGIDLAAASSAQQFEVVAAIEKSNRPFFELVRDHTMQGYYGSPRHGGNRDAVSWRMLGLAEPPIRGRAQYDQTAGSKP